jgi:hypothetical protein
MKKVRERCVAAQQLKAAAQRQQHQAQFSANSKVLHGGSITLMPYL